MGRRAITLLQFTKNKPIKHGIKVFACCCAYYCGKENTSKEETSTTAIFDDLMKMAGLTGQRGRVVVTDNY